MGHHRKIKNSITALIFLSFAVFGFAQKTHYSEIQINENLQSVINDSIGKKIISQLDVLFYQINNYNIDRKRILDENADLTVSLLKGLKGFDNEQNDNLKNEYNKQLIEFYPLDTDIYSLSIAFFGSGTNKKSLLLKTIFNLIVFLENDIAKFSLPLTYHTKNWKTTEVGDITYKYQDTIQLDRARIFNNKNIIISKKLKVPTERFTFYMCKNYQVILNLLGYDYQLESATTYKDGYGVAEGSIFSIMNNEDFSHDVFHYYSGKIHKANNRNWIAEEGIACSWGNAYYADKNGEMIELQALALELKKYLQANKGIDLLTLFVNNTKIYDHIDSELSVRSVISGIICNEIEKQKGIDGIIKIINSGRSPSSMDAYFNVLDDLLAINKGNFNTKLKLLLEHY